MEEYGKKMKNSSIAADQPEVDFDDTKITRSKQSSITEAKGIFVTQKGKKKGYDTLEKTIIFAP